MCHSISVCFLNDWAHLPAVFCSFGEDGPKFKFHPQKPGSRPGPNVPMPFLVHIREGPCCCEARGCSPEEQGGPIEVLSAQALRSLGFDALEAGGSGHVRPRSVKESPNP